MSRQDIENAGPWRIEQLRGLATRLGAAQAILFTWSQETGTVIDTWGVDAKHSSSAAAGANMIKKDWGWPENTIVESAKVQALYERIEQLEQELSRCQAKTAPQRYVHIIEGIEHERGWGQRPDGYIAFHSEEAAKAYINEYDKRWNNEPTVPAEYTKYRYIGAKTCSDGFFKVVSMKGLKHFNHLSELLE